MKRLLPLLALAFVFAAPSAAQAADVLIDGSPLNVHVGDTGRLQARFDGETSGEFYSPSSNEANAGFLVGLDVGTPEAQLWGFTGVAFTPVSQSAIGGDGSAANPFQQVTTYRADYASTNDFVLVTQTVKYLNGQTEFSVRYDVAHDGGSAGTTIRPFEAADLFVSGSDSGVGFLTAGPPRVVGGVNQNVGASGGIVEVTPWDRFEEAQYNTVFSHARDLSPSGGLTNTISSELIDNGVGVQWPDTSICGPSCPGADSAAFEAIWRFRRFQALTLDPTSAARLPGNPQTINIAATDADGNPAANVTIPFTISGANPGQGVVTTGPEGRTSITWTGNNAGDDVLQVFADLNGDGQQQANEPQRQATVRWLGGVVAGRTLGVEPVEGQVFVKGPPGQQARLARSLGVKQSQAGAPPGFLPLPAAGIVPVGTTIHTLNGKVRLQSAANAAGATQTGLFFEGLFQVKQRAVRSPVTEISLKGGSFRSCGRSGKASISAKRGKRVRRLWGDAKGRYRTRGRYSSATVRGTTWLVQDYCGGTLTKLPRTPKGSKLTVRDLVRKTNRSLRSGQSYFAAAKRGK